MRKLVSILILGVFVVACAKDTKESKANSPMSVARIWLENYYYHNNFELAKTYSTAKTAEMIDTIKTMIFREQSAGKINFEIKNIQCKQKQGAKTAECSCKYEEEGEPFTELLYLVQQDGQWLVDAQMVAEEELLLDEDIEKMTKDFEKSLDKMLEQ